jgi:hypothetical protein
VVGQNSRSEKQSTRNAAGDGPMKVIAEYEIPIARVQNISLPRGSKIIEVRPLPDHPEVPIMWVLQDQMDQETEMETYGLLMGQSGTKYSNDIELEYISSFSIRGGSHRIHVFMTKMFMYLD